MGIEHRVAEVPGVVGGPRRQQVLTQSNAPSGAWSERAGALDQFKALWKLNGS
jgi:hypothetical protein